MIQQEIEYDGKKYFILIGENAKDNWNIIDISDGEDIWFHVDDYPSSHVVLKMEENNNINTLLKQLIIECGQISKSRSKAKDLKKVNIIYTEIKNIKKGKTPGSVTTTNVRNIKI